MCGKHWKKVFGVESKARVLQLRCEINVMIKESLSTEYYYLKIKEIANKLACFGSAISDKGLLQ